MTPLANDTDCQQNQRTTITNTLFDKNVVTRSYSTENAMKPISKAARLRELIQTPQLAFLMEAHNGLSAKIVEEAGFDAIWASGLSMSATLGVRDSNEASWTQVLEVLEFMSDATQIPILVDGDTGYGNFNNMRRLVRKLEQRAIAGVCIEDKLFPKTNSFINGTAQPLAEINEFCGRIQAGKDSQCSDDFVIVARVEAFIAGWGLAEALKRAEAYHQAGADAILIHSAQRNPAEILAFKREWGDRLPVVIVPTKYYTTSTAVFRDEGFAAVIWANHMMRACITAMQSTAKLIFQEQSLINVEDKVAPISEVFRLQGAEELEEAEKRYLPQSAKSTRAIVLGAAHGPEMGQLTDARPKCMLDVAGAPVLAHIVATYRAAGVKDITVIRGWNKHAVILEEDVRYCDNDDESEPTEAFSLYKAMAALEGSCIISYGDVLFKKYIPLELMDVEAEFAVIVDTNWRESRNRDRYAEYVTCSKRYSRHASNQDVCLVSVSEDIPPESIDGEWMGFLKTSPTGTQFLRELLVKLCASGPQPQPLQMVDILCRIIESGKTIRVIYTAGNWLDIDRVEDVLAGSSFR
jgi:phosphoenolpyruvate phosphomutase